MERTRFQLLHAGQTVWEFAVMDDLNQVSVEQELDEQKNYQFVVQGRDPALSYALLLGDDDWEEGLVEGLDHLRDVIWTSQRYFESCVSFTSVCLYSRPIDDQESQWVRVLQVSTRVNPSKITRALYDAMVEDLRSISASLIFDVVSKSSRQIGFGAFSKKLATVPANIELRRLERLYEMLTQRLNEVAANPATKIVKNRAYRRIDSRAVFDAFSCASLAARGLDPRASQIDQSQIGWVWTKSESTSSIENGIILGFLALLKGRFQQCARRAERQSQVLEAIKPYRQIVDGSTPLFDSEELPRIRRLEMIRTQAWRLSTAVNGLEKRSLFDGCVALHDLRSTPIFRHVPSYNAVFGLIRNFLQFDQWVLEEGSEERIKLTSRLYEHWVFLQIVGAFRFCGLSGDAYEGLFRQLAATRFTLDLDKGTAIMFKCPDGQLVRIRCEPFVLPLELAVRQKEAVYDARRERYGFPNPDVLIEFIEGKTDDEVPNVVFAVTVDAKYKAQVRSDDWNKAQKYFKICSTTTRRRVMRQLWLVHPASSGVRPDDESVEWGRPVDPWQRDEELRGTVGMLPPAHPRGTEAEVFRVSVGAIEFVSGLLTFYKGPNRLWSNARDRLLNLPV